MDERGGAPPHARDGLVHYLSRSRQAVWKKGETSGALQRVVELLTDCDQDVLLVRAEVAERAGTCHTGRTTCFYRRVPLGAGPIERPFEPRGGAALARPAPPRQAVAIYSRIWSASRSTSSIRRFTTSPIETMPASLPFVHDRQMTEAPARHLLHDVVDRVLGPAGHDSRRHPLRRGHREPVAAVLGDRAHDVALGDDAADGALLDDDDGADPLFRERRGDRPQSRSRQRAVTTSRPFSLMIRATVIGSSPWLGSLQGTLSLV